MKKVFAVTTRAMRSWMVPYKLYEAADLDPGAFTIVDKSAPPKSYFLWKKCAFLDGGNWTRVELDVPDAPAKVDEAHLEAQQVMHKLDTLIAALKSALADVGEVMP